MYTVESRTVPLPPKSGVIFPLNPQWKCYSTTRIKAFGKASNRMLDMAESTRVLDYSQLGDRESESGVVLTAKS